MAEIASAFVSLMPSVKGFGSKLDQQVGGEVEKSGKKVGARFGSAFKASTAVGITAGVASAPLYRVGPSEDGGLLAPSAEVGG